MKVIRMKLHSLGFQSQLIFTSFDGRAKDSGDHWEIHTLSNPNFFWGNLLIFDRPPRMGDYATWTSQFKEAFADRDVHHITLAWQSSTGDIGDVSEFLAKDFILESTTVLSASEVIRPPKYNEDLEVRRLVTSSEWERMVEIQTLSTHGPLSTATWEAFYRSQAERFQRMEKAGFGSWYGGFVEGVLVAGLGIFHRDRLGRFQTVCTDPHFQRQGICQTLVYQSSRLALSSGNMDTLVMCADPDYHAIQIYELVGYQRQITENGVYWWDKTKHR
jgi:hypothetical protein